MIKKGFDENQFLKIIYKAMKFLHWPLFALTVAGISAVIGYLPAGFGLSPWLSLALGAGCVVLVIWRLGKSVHH